MYAARILLKSLVGPPAICFVVGLLGLALLRRRPNLGRALLGGSVASLYAFCLPLVGTALLRTLEGKPLPLAARAEAIVVLAADSSPSPEYGGRTVGSDTMARLRYAALLHRRTEAPILASGGRETPNRADVAILMRATLENELGVPVRWVETASRNTWENARESAAILSREGIRRVFLVTHAWHVPRARWSFEANGIEVVPAPTVFVEARGAGPGDFLPSATGLDRSARAIREWVGLLYYRVAYPGTDRS